MGDSCPLCGFVLKPFMQRLQAMYAISFGFFVTTLIYAVVVYFFDTRGVRIGVAMPAMLPYILLVAAVLVLGVARKLEAPSQVRDMARIQSVFLVKLAMVESVALMGFVIYLLSGSLHWFVTFLAVSWLGFIIVGSQMPALVNRMAELAVEQEPGLKRV